MGMTPDGTTNTAARTCPVDATGTRTTIPSLVTTTVMSATRTNRKKTIAKAMTTDTTVIKKNPHMIGNAFGWAQTQTEDQAIGRGDGDSTDHAGERRIQPHRRTLQHSGEIVMAKTSKVFGDKSVSKLWRKTTCFHSVYRNTCKPHTTTA